MTMWTDLAFGTGMTTLVCLGDSRHVVIGPQTSTDQRTRCLVGYAQSEVRMWRLALVHWCVATVSVTRGQPGEARLDDARI